MTLRTALLFAALTGAAGLAGCSSFKPVYGDGGIATAEVQAGTFQYAKPVTQLDQIIYQQLMLKLGLSRASTAPLVQITTSSTTRDLTKSDVLRPNEQHEAVVTAEIKITSPSGAVVFNTTRFATAVYTTDGQGLADNEAQRGAETQAATELAETIRLTLIGSMGLKAS